MGFLSLLPGIVTGAIQVAEDVFGPHSGGSKQQFALKIAHDAATTVQAARGQSLPDSFASDVKALIDAQVKVMNDLGLLPKSAAAAAPAE